MGMWDEVVEGLEDLVDALRKDEVLDRFRVHKVVRNDDGTVKRVTSDPETGIKVTTRKEK